MMREFSLAADSRFYYTAVAVYDRLAQAEDASGLIAEYLRGRFEGLRVLDLGCGTGKYLELLGPRLEFCCGLDRSPAALALAQSKTAALGNVRLVCADAERLPLADAGFDVVFAAWVLGTLPALENRRRVLSECRRILKPNGRIVLIENDSGGEFERLRGRWPDDQRTREYNQELVEQWGFSEALHLQTEFRFETAAAAAAVFSTIWGAPAGQVIAPRIEHRVVIFELEVVNIGWD